MLFNACSMTPSAVDSGQTPFGDAGGVWARIEGHMPFDAGYASRCTQGAFGPYSHNGASTRYDVDFDTPNDREDMLFAPVNGTAYVHDANPNAGFGIHVNIDLGDGTYVVLAHLDSVFVANGASVAMGMPIGIECTTGNSTGDHLHIGRHQGLASLDAAYGDSISGFAIVSADADGAVRARETTEYECDLQNGRVYISQLTTPRWHPDGTLVKSPHSPDVYLLEGGKLRLYPDEAAFWARNRDFADLAIVSPAEMACYAWGTTFTGAYSVDAVYDGGKVYLLEVENGVKTRREVPFAHWPSVLESWGFDVSTTSDLPTAAELGVSISSYSLREPAGFRDGTLLREASVSTVYVVSNGVAMPVADWNTFVLLGFASRRIQWVDDGAVAAVESTVGNCVADVHCIRESDVLACGGPADAPNPSTGGYGGAEEEEENSVEEEAESNPEETEGTTLGPVDTGTEGLLRIVWTMPGGRTASRITLAGEYTDVQTGNSGWFTAGEVYNTTQIAYEVPGAETGESFRFSVEYVEGGQTSWSCLAPYPPGTVQGTPSATFAGTAIAVQPVGDPTSAGCGLLAVVP